MVIDFKKDHKEINLDVSSFEELVDFSAQSIWSYWLVHRE